MIQIFIVLLTIHSVYEILYLTIPFVIQLYHISNSIIYLFSFFFFLFSSAKWVAKLREFKTDKNCLLLKTDLSSGHFSASDRYKFLKETAFEYSFILDQITKK